MELVAKLLNVLAGRRLVVVCHFAHLSIIYRLERV
jgi:hypothetical protein